MNRLIRYLFKPPASLVKNLIGTITYVETQQPLIALTFDDGPHPIYTPQLLEVLQKYGAKATFFMVGESAMKYPEIVKQVILAGHAVGNHTWNHLSLPLISGRERRKQFRDCAKVLSWDGPKLLRPPYGDQNIWSCLDAWLLGYKVITWRVNGNDWLDHEPQWIAENIIKQVRPGDIILLHDALQQPNIKSAIDRSNTIIAVDIVLNRLSGQYRVVGVPELFKSGKPHKQNWFKKPDLNWLETKNRAYKEIKQ